MSDEYEPNPAPAYSSFWPLFIVLCGLLIWSGYQVYAANSLRSAGATQFEAAKPTIAEANNVRDRYVALMKALVQTAQKDSTAAQIVKDAVKSGMIRLNPSATNGAASAHPAAAK